MRHGRLCQWECFSVICCSIPGIPLQRRRTDLWSPVRCWQSVSLRSVQVSHAVFSFARHSDARRACHPTGRWPWCSSSMICPPPPPPFPVLIPSSCGCVYYFLTAAYRSRSAVPACRAVPARCQCGLPRLPRLATGGADAFAAALATDGTCAGSTCWM